MQGTNKARNQRYDFQKIKRRIYFGVVIFNLYISSLVLDGIIIFVKTIKSTLMNLIDDHVSSTH